MRYIDQSNLEKNGIETFIFPGGEPYAKVSPLENDIFLRWNITSMDEWGKVMSVLDALHSSDDHNMILFLPYFPGARQDRDVDGTPFTMSLNSQMLSDFINWWPTDKLVVLDIHSDMALETLSDWMPCLVENVMPYEFLTPEWFGCKYDGIIAPDKGAVLRASNFQTVLFPDAHFYVANKKRDFDSGRILDVEIGAISEPGKYLIVDDICDGGGTFKLLSDKLRASDAGKKSEIHLWVTHGIFSKGFRDMGIDKFFTTDSWWRSNPDEMHNERLIEVFMGDGLKVFELKNIYERLTY